MSSRDDQAQDRRSVWTPLRRALRPLAGLAVSCGLLAWVLVQADLASVLELLASSNLGWLALAYTLYLLAAVVHALRFSVLLSASGTAPRFVELVRAHSIGLACNTILPGELGLDAARVQIAGRSSGGRTRVVGIVMVDRLNGAIAVAATACLGYWLLAGHDLPIWFLIPPLAVMAIGILIGVFICFATERWIGRLTRIAWLPEFVRRKCLILAESITTTGRGERLLWATALAAVQCVVLAFSLAMVSHGLGLPAQGWEVAAIFPIIAIITLTTPVSINGLGVREAMFCLTGLHVGLNENQALALAAAWLLVMLAGCIPGAIALLGIAPSGRESDTTPVEQPAAANRP